MIIYKIGKIIPNYKNRYLSSRVKEEKSTLSLDEKSYIYSFLGIIKQNWLVIFLLILIPFLFGLMPSYEGILNFENINVGVNGTQEFLKSTFAVPLSLIGIIIPVIILIIEILGKMSDCSLIKSYLSILDPFRVFVISLAFLALSTIMFFLSTMNYDLTNETIKYYISIGFISIAIPLVITAKLVFKTIKLVDNSFYELMIKQMREEITNTINSEIDDQLFKRSLEDECKRINLVFQPWFSRRDFIPLRSSKIGLIKDIDLDKLENFGNLIREIPNNENIEIFVVIIKYPGQYVSRNNDILGYVNMDENFVSDLVVELNKVFIIDE